jgi:NAD(P)-dependent dehydrogenase (short-subunit alcohol dehydrogenase family)
MLRGNLDSAAYVCRAALPHLRQQGGSIVAIGSRAAETGGSGMAAYAVSKLALHALVRVLAQENRAHGVRVNAVLPGTIDTPANRGAMKSADTSGWTSADKIAQVVATSASARPSDGSGGGSRLTAVLRTAPKRARDWQRSQPARCRASSGGAAPGGLSCSEAIWSSVRQSVAKGRRSSRRMVAGASPPGVADGDVLRWARWRFKRPRPVSGRP